jgi:SAM-dependent methyltransferase
VKGPEPRAVAAIWDQVEHGVYNADLGLWTQLAAEARGPVLDLGCGSGRVALHLGRAGHDVWALDLDPELIGALAERASAEAPTVTARVADARSFALDREFGLIVAPMQLVQILGGAEGRGAMLARVRDHLAADGLFAATVIDPPLTWGDAGDEVLPDVLERDGWVFSSRPLRVRPEGATLVVERLRQTVSPTGALIEEPHDVRLDVVSAGDLEAEGAAAGLEPAGRRAITPTDDHVGSVAVLFRRRGAKR